LILKFNIFEIFEHNHFLPLPYGIFSSSSEFFFSKRLLNLPSQPENPF